MPTSTQPSAAWYRFPIVWLMLSIPVISIISGIAMLVIASGVKDPVLNTVKKSGLNVTPVEAVPARSNAAANQ